MAEDNTIKLVDDFVNYIRNKYKEHFITEFKSMFGPVSNEEAGFNMFVKEDGTVLADRLYLKPESQKKGIGTKIMQELFEWSNKNNQPFEFILMAGYEDLSSPSKTVQTQKAFQEKLKDVPGLEAFPSEQGLLDTNITTYKYTPQLDTPTNVVDDFKLSGTMGGNTTPTGVNIAYANVEDIEKFIQFDRKAEGNLERINSIKKTILDKGYLYDTAYEGGVVFGVIVDEAGNVQIPEGNHRLQALIDVAKETGQKIYVPINPMLTSTGGGNKVQLTNSDNAYNSMKQLLTDMLEGNKNFNVERTISEKLGEPGTRIIGLESYTYPGGQPGTSTTQSNIKKFFNSIGLNTITYDELPDNSIYKTGINTFIDTPTNVVDEGRLVWGSDEFIDAILDDMRAAAQLFEMDETEITPLTQQYINEEKLSVANHVDFIEVYQETLDRTDLPEGMSKAKAADEILMFVEAAQYEQRTQGTGKINGLTIPELGVTDLQAQDPEFKKLLTQQFADTPTNVVDDAPLLETRMKINSDSLIPGERGIERWADDVITPNKVFNPDSFTRIQEQGFRVWTKTTEFDYEEMYKRLLNNTATDEDITKFFIFTAGYSPTKAFAYKSFQDADARADIVKIGIFSDRPIIEIIPMGDQFNERQFLANLLSRNPQIKQEDITRLLVELVNEQGQFANLKERMRNVLINAHKEIYKNNPNDYFILWRGGNLNRFYPWQSFSKKLGSAWTVANQMNQVYSGGSSVNSFIINKNNMIDLDALGLSHMDEQEVIVLTEEAKSQYAQRAKNIELAKDIDNINNWWLEARQTDAFTKQGQNITNISAPIADAGQSTQDWFNTVLQGIDERYRPKKPYEQIIDLDNPKFYKWQDDYNKLVVEGGNFNQHIFTSIPTFYETQIVKGLALSNLIDTLPNVTATGRTPDGQVNYFTILDIGGTEGTWAKALAKNNPNIDVTILDPLQSARDTFENGEYVSNARFEQKAFSYLPEDADRFFKETGQAPVRFETFNSNFRYNVVHESMAFQFIDSNRVEQIKFIKENVLAEDGILIIEEKFINTDSIYKANEQLKNEFKSQYYTQEQLNNKKLEVLLSMENNQVSVQEIEKILGENFANVQQYWDSGNFKGYIASDNDVVNQFVPEINNLEVSLTDHRFSTAPTEKEVKAAVQNKMQQGGTDSKLAAQLANETVAKNPNFFKRIANVLGNIDTNAGVAAMKLLGRLGVVAGPALSVLGRVAPGLAPGDVAIEKTIQKAVPYLDDAAAKLGFARLQFGNILPTYIAYEIGVALADVAQAALYADSSAYKYREGGAVYNQLRQPELDATGKPVKVLGMSAYDYFQTPPGKKQLEEFDFGSQFMKELDQEKISKYSPGWGLTKGLLFLISEAYKSGTDQTTSDYTTKLKENPAMIYNAGFTGSNK